MDQGLQAHGDEEEEGEKEGEADAPSRARADAGVQTAPVPADPFPTHTLEARCRTLEAAELEAHLLAHPAVSDCVVIGVESEREGEVPKAFVVKAASSIEEADALIKRSIKKHVEQHLSRHKWLAGGIEFIDVVPKSPSGKILRRLVRDQEKEKRRKAGAKL